MHSNSMAPLNQKPSLRRKTINKDAKTHSLYGLPPIAHDDPLARVATLIDESLTKVIENNSHLSKNTNAYTAEKIYPLSIQDFIKYIAQFLKFNGETIEDIILPEDLITALIYLDRFFCANKKDFINHHNVHSLLLIALLLAHKYLEDAPFQNRAFACIYKIPVDQLNCLEELFLATIHFDCYVSGETYQAYEACLLSSSQTPVHLATNTLLNTTSLLFPTIHFIKKPLFQEEESSYLYVAKSLSIPQDNSSETSSPSNLSINSTASTMDSPEAGAVSPVIVYSDPLPQKTVQTPVSSDPNPFHLTRTTSMLFAPNHMVDQHVHAETKLKEFKLSGF